jgi:hypothetical protein
MCRLPMSRIAARRSCARVNSVPIPSHPNERRANFGRQAKGLGYNLICRDVGFSRSFFPLLQFLELCLELNLNSLTGQTSANKPEWGFIIFHCPDDTLRRSRRVARLSPLNGELEDIMDAAVFLVSDAAAMITGTSLLIDGGIDEVHLRSITEPVRHISQIEGTRTRPRCPALYGQ